MTNKTDVYIYNPSQKTGGTNNLLFNVALLLNAVEDYNIFYLDYENSPLVKMSKDADINWTYLIIEEGKKIAIADGIIIATLLDLKLIKKILLLSDSTRMLFWSTHPDDGLKILSSFNLWLRLPQNCRVVLATILHPFLKRRIEKFMNTGIASNGIIYMDNINVNSNKKFYKLEEKGKVVPIFTNFPRLMLNVTKEFLSPAVIKIVVLGRFADFKVNSIYGLVEQIIDYNVDNLIKIEIDFIGNGPLLDETKAWIEKKGLLNCKYYGHVNLTEIDDFIVKYDSLIAMGTSVLEGAKLAIPSLLIDASYDKLPKEKVKLNWLFEAELHEVGRFVSVNDSKIDGKNINKIVAELLYSKERIGEKCYEHWLAFHSPVSSLKYFTHIIKTNSFIYGQNKRFLKDDFISRLINYSKGILK